MCKNDIIINITLFGIYLFRKNWNIKLIWWTVLFPKEVDPDIRIETLSLQQDGATTHFGIGQRGMFAFEKILGRVVAKSLKKNISTSKFPEQSIMLPLSRIYDTPFVLGAFGVLNALSLE